MFLYLCIIFSRPFAVFLIRLLIMWIPEFLMVYKIRGERAGWVMSRVGNDRGGELDRGGRGRGGGVNRLISLNRWRRLATNPPLRLRSECMGISYAVICSEIE